MKSKLLLIIQGICVACICSTCGYQLSTSITQNYYHANTNNDQLLIFLDSYDSFHTIMRSIKNELYLNQVKIIDSNDNNLQIYNKIPHLNIMSVSKRYVTVSVFPDGTESEYLIILKVQAQYFIPNKNKNYYPITIQICRTVIKNPEQILPNLIQDNEILNMMYKDAAYKLIKKFLNQLIYIKQDI